jgi:hypothetical protein
VHSEECLLEELFQVLGPFNDTENITPSLFSNYDSGPYLLSQDRIVLEALYLPDIKPGMTATQALPIVRRFMAAKLL